MEGPRVELEDLAVSSRSMPRATAPKVAPSFDVIVEREFELRKGRKQTKVLARFGKPVPDRGAFRCEFQIAGLLDKPIVRAALGEDGIQALELAMRLATNELLSSRAYQSGRMTFLATYDLRMPLLNACRALIRWDLEAKRLAEEIRTGSDRSNHALRAALADRSTRTSVRPTDAPVIVERELELRKQRKRTKVLVRFRKPVPHRHGFYCVFQIEGLLEKPPSKTGMFGIDGIEALEKAMQLAMVYVLSSNAYQRGRLTWFGMYDLGLPVMDEIVPLIRKDLDAARFAKEITTPLAKRVDALNASRRRLHRRRPPRR